MSMHVNRISICNMCGGAKDEGMPHTCNTTTTTTGNWYWTGTDSATATFAPFYGHGIADLLETKKPKKTIMSIIKDLAKSKERKALEEFSLVNEDGSLNERGRGEFVMFLFEGANKDAFEAKIVEAYEIRKANNK